MQVGDGFIFFWMIKNSLEGFTSRCSVGYESNKTIKTIPTQIRGKSEQNGLLQLGAWTKKPLAQAFKNVADARARWNNHRLIDVYPEKLPVEWAFDAQKPSVQWFFSAQKTIVSLVFGTPKKPSTAKIFGDAFSDFALPWGDCGADHQGVICDDPQSSWSTFLVVRNGLPSKKLGVSNNT